ncbi:MAG: hypothetical protein GF418_01340 [Chitinivibrionales bacterium]|nr:hypothetical protein [Chitinivibrionales bacterium]MBD3394246.1 hypothetical protein [Chitinivibrionales bacterium]
MTTAGRAAVRRAFEAYLKRHRLSYTSQRACVLNEILLGPAHFDVEALVDQVRRKKAGVSRATIYRTVSHLARAKLVRKMDFDEACARYEIVSKEHHHEHLVCERCGAIVEFTDPKLEQRIRRMADRHGMAMTRHFVQIIGLCDTCRRRERPGRGKGGRR